MPASVGVQRTKNLYERIMHLCDLSKVPFCRADPRIEVKKMKQKTKEIVSLLDTYIYSSQKAQLTERMYLLSEAIKCVLIVDRTEEIK